jgi:hypothetical protein
MSSPPSHRTQNRTPDPQPDRGSDLFAPAEPPIAPGDPTVTHVTGRHARHRRTEDDPPEPVEPVVAPAWLPVPQAAHTPPHGTPIAGIPVPEVPVPVFDTPPVRVPDPPADPGPADPRPRHRPDFDRTDPTPDRAAGPVRPRPDLDRTVPDPEAARPADGGPSATGGHRGAAAARSAPGPDLFEPSATGSHRGGSGHAEGNPLFSDTTEPRPLGGSPSEQAAPGPVPADPVPPATPRPPVATEPRTDERRPAPPPPPTPL